MAVLRLRPFCARRSFHFFVNQLSGCQRYHSHAHSIFRLPAIPQPCTFNRHFSQTFASGFADSLISFHCSAGIWTWCQSEKCGKLFSCGKTMKLSDLPRQVSRQTVPDTLELLQLSYRLCCRIRVAFLFGRFFIVILELLSGLFPGRQFLLEQLQFGKQIGKSKQQQAGTFCPFRQFRPFSNCLAPLYRRPV